MVLITIPTTMSRRRNFGVECPETGIRTRVKVGKDSGVEKGRQDRQTESDKDTDSQSEGREKR